MNKSEKRYWVIEREENQKIVFQSIVPIGQITEKQLENLIIALNVKHNLTDEESVSCFLKKNTKRHFDFLKIKRDSSGKRLAIYCENSLDITAAVFTESELPSVTKKKRHNHAIKRTEDSCVLPEKQNQ